ncbi:MAG TPA: hypothetical protein VFB82_19760, partial [Blastocatellia bacterium]|nr:hypothetical protein [Blastocatellia bacterium]
GELQKLVERHGRIELIFGTWWQERKFVCNLSPLAIFSSAINTRDWLDDNETCDCSADFLCDLVRISGATQMMLYAESGREGFLPRSEMSAYVPSISFLWRSLRELQQIVHSATGVTLTESHPHMSILVPKTGPIHIGWTGVAKSRRPA